MRIISLQLPLTENSIANLSQGDKLLISGEVLTARDAAHQKMIQILDEGKSLPFDLTSTTLFYCGPSPKPLGKICGAIGPTTSYRMDVWTPQLLELGLKVMIGKGERSIEVVDAIRKHKAMYLVAVGGAAAYLARHIVSCETFLWPEMGTEAIHKLIFCNFPVYVAIV